MFEKLKKKDPEYAQKIHKNNTKRVLRAIEILTITNKTNVDIEEAYLKVNLISKSQVLAITKYMDDVASRIKIEEIIEK